MFLTRQVLKLRYKSSPLVGSSAIAIMALADKLMLDNKDVNELINIYYGALDVGVTGEVAC